MEKIDAANQLKREVNRLKALHEIADDLERLGSLENAEAETLARLSALTIQEDQAKARVGEARDEAAALVAQGRVDADNLRAEAETEKATAAELVARAEKVLDDARSEARKIVEDARGERGRIEAEIRAALAERVDKVLGG